VFTNGEGVADLGGRNAVPQSDAEALAIATGISAESLSVDYPPPQVPQSPPLEAQVEEASFAADTARKAVWAAEDSARRLLALHDAGLLLTELPREVTHLMERRTAEAKALTAQKAMVGVTEERNSLRLTVQNLEYRLARVPVSVDQQRQECFLRDRLEKARAELAKAESKLKKAEAAQVDGRKAVPTSL
jgi:hypothetical protein